MLQQNATFVKSEYMDTKLRDAVTGRGKVSKLYRLMCNFISKCKISTIGGTLIYFLWVCPVVKTFWLKVIDYLSHDQLMNSNLAKAECPLNTVYPIP